MKEKIEELIQHHNLACLELKELINELYGLKEKTDDVDLVIDKYASELAWRRVFIGQLEELL